MEAKKEKERSARQYYDRAAVEERVLELANQALSNRVIGIRLNLSSSYVAQIRKRIGAPVVERDRLSRLE